MSGFPQGSGAVKRDDRLHHHSVPGVYRVLHVMHDGRIVLLDPRNERQRVWPDYVADNFSPAPPATDQTETEDARDAKG